MLVKWWSLGYFFWDIWTFQYGCQMSRGKTSQNGTWSTKQGLTTPTSHNDGMLSSMWYTQQQTILLKYTRNGWYKPFPTGSDSIFFVCISSCWTNNLAFKTKPLSGKKKRSPIFTSQNTDNCFLTNPSTFLRIQQDISFDKYSVFCWHPILIGSYRWKKNKNVFFPLVIGDVSFFPFQICGLSQSCQSPILLGENPWKSCFRSQFSNPKSQLSHEKSQFSHAKSISEPRSRARSRNQQHSCYLESWRWEHQGLGFEETKRWMVFMGFNKNSWDFMGFYGI